MKPNETVVTPHEETNEHEIRKLKVKKMMDEGVSPWPEHKPVSHTNAQALEAFKKDPTITQTFQLAGRVMTRRDHGKSFFCNIMDRSATIQLYIKKDVIGDHAFEQFKHLIDTGDIVWVEGTLFVTKMGETTLNVQKIELLSKCLHPLPEKFHGLTDVEQRYRQRYLDLISNPESKEKFKKRSYIVQAIRNFLQSRDFLEVETPMLHPIPGGAAARPFVTHHNAYDMPLYLRIAPELYLKRLVVGGFERVFEINRNFRNEGVSTRHNPEFTMLEFYMAHGDYQDGMALVEQLFAAVINSISLPAEATSPTGAERRLGDSMKLMFNDKEIDFTPPFKRMTVVESLIHVGGLTAPQLTPETIDATLKAHNVTVHQSAGLGFKLFALFEACVESKLVQPTFIIGYPLEVSPLAKRDVNNPEYAARFELFINGMECANGFTELNDPFDQAERFKSQVAAREGGDTEAHHYDADYIKALEFGLAPAVGVGIGVDRVVMLMTNTHSIKDVILFPTLKLVAE